MPAPMPTLRPLLAEGDDDLARACAQPEPERDAVLDALAVLEAPTPDLVTSAVTLRVAAAAAQEGRAFVHHELRHPLPVPEDLLPEIDTGALEVGWTGGILSAPKYFSAFLDAPLPTYDPNHRAKWRAHELLHRLARFVWRPDLTRFEAYLGSRLSELLPVVHWYGFDEVGRGKCPEHQGVVLRRELCEACEAAGGPYWTVDVDTAVARAHATAAFDHLATELAACAREQETGRQHPTPRVGLDAASDAVGYLRGHWNRTTAWSFGAWVELFLTEGEDYFGTTLQMREHVDTLVHRLLRSAVDVNADTAARARDRRFAQDLGYRILASLETLDDAAEDAVRPALEALATGGPDRETLAAIDDRFAFALAGGALWRRAPTASVDLVVDGLRSALPRSLADVDDASLHARAATFVQARAFRGPGEIFVRFAAFAGSPAMQLEAWLRRRPTIDLEAERFATVPDDRPSGGLLRLNATLRRGLFEPDALATVLGWEVPSVEPVELVAVHFGGEPRAFERSAEVDTVLNAAQRGQWTDADETTQTLLEAGALVWLPAPR